MTQNPCLRPRLSRSVSVEPTRLFHGQREAVESDSCGDSPAQPFHCRPKTSSARSGESESERSCANMRRQSPHDPKHDRTGGGGLIAQVRCRSPRYFDQSQIWSGGSGEEAVIVRIAIDVNGARGAAGCVYYQCCGVPPLLIDVDRIVGSQLSYRSNRSNA